MEKLKIFINGFGRIGRCITKIILTQHAQTIEIVGINDLGDIDMLHYLFAHDSIHKSHLPIQKIAANILQIGSQQITFSNHPSPNEVDVYDAHLVLEASGHFLSSNDAQNYLKKGAKKVIFAAPAHDETPTFVLGVNHQHYQNQAIISNASCTTNCLAPLVMLLDEAFGVEGGILTTIHSYTNDQNILDAAHKSDFRRSRAAAINIIPTTTGAAKALHLVLPQMKNKLHGHSIRVPIADVSMVDLNVLLQKRATKEAINELFLEASKQRLKGILGVDEKFGVSQDFIDNPLSCIVAADLTFVLDNNMAKVMAWYDNEWGYANRIVEMAAFVWQHAIKEKL